jgi:hypothetical protein
MSVSSLFDVTCDYNLFCKSITAQNSTTMGNVVINGNLDVVPTAVNGDLTVHNGTSGAILAIGSPPNNYYFNYDTVSSGLALLQSGTAQNGNFVVSLGTGAMVVLGDIQLANSLSGIYFGTNVNNFFNVYQSEHLTIPFSGPYASSQNVVCAFTRIGNLITMTLPELLSASTISSNITAVIPPSKSLYFPANTVNCIIQVYNLNTSTQGYISITNGNITITGAFGTPFSNSSNCGFNGFSVSYSL